MAAPIDLAATMLGRNEGPDRATIQQYLKTGGAGMDPATVAWCAAFVNSSLAQSGLPTTGSNLARSFLNYGDAAPEPQRGDIAVFPRGDPNGPYGHVGFVDQITGEGPNRMVRLLAGNQGNAVSYADVPFAQALGFRRPPAMAQAAPPAPPGPPQQPGAPGVPGPSSPGPTMPAPPSPPMPPGPNMMPNRGVPLNTLASAPGIGTQNFGQLAQMYVQQGEARQQRDAARRQALLGGGGAPTRLAALYSS